jgi:hypothetical protein
MVEPIIDSIVLCDIVRQEDSGKLLLVGVYLGGLSFAPGVPRQPVALHVVVQVGGMGDVSDVVSRTFEVAAPGGALVASFRETRPVPTGGMSSWTTICALSFLPFVDGPYVVTFDATMSGKLGQRVLRKSVEFVIGAPQGYQPPVAGLISLN